MTEMPGIETTTVTTLSPNEVILGHIVGDLEIPCDYGETLNCGPAAAQWDMFVRCGCGNMGHRLACDGCKNSWLTSEEAAECRACGEVFLPARKAFARVEKL